MEIYGNGNELMEKFNKGRKKLNERGGVRLWRS